MRTNYQNLTAFETAAIGMVVLGLALIGFQFWAVAPEQAKANVVDALQVLDMNETVDIQLAVNEFVFTGVQQFMDRFAYEAMDMFAFVGEDYKAVSAQAQVAFASFTKLSDNLASNYQANYVQPGVEADMGGKVLGAYLEQLEQFAAQVVPVQQ